MNVADKVVQIATFLNSIVPGDKNLADIYDQSSMKSLREREDARSAEYRASLGKPYRAMSRFFSY